MPTRKVPAKASDTGLECKRIGIDLTKNFGGIFLITTDTEVVGISTNSLRKVRRSSGPHFRNELPRCSLLYQQDCYSSRMLHSA